MRNKRVSSEELEEILYEKMPILDHGFIRVIDYMGDDSSIVQAARVSYGTGTKKVNEDQGLINYLMRHRHTTPFEMPVIRLHIKAPIFVTRQWLRHRTASVNEYSARYSILSKEFYVPETQNICKQSIDNKQGRGDTYSELDSAVFQALIKSTSEIVYDDYLYMMEQDVAREIARTCLTLNYYTEFYWQINLHNLLHFLKLRADKHAQYEIRVYAEAMLEIVKKWVPMTYSAFEEYVLNSVTLSRKSIKAVEQMIKDKNICSESSGLSKGELKELMSIFDND